MAPKFTGGDVMVSFSGKWISYIHTGAAYAAFVGALITGLALHYHKIVQNQYYVSRTVGETMLAAAYKNRSRAILKSGSHQCLLPLVTGILSAQCSSSSLPSRPVIRAQSCLNHAAC